MNVVVMFENPVYKYPKKNTKRILWNIVTKRKFILGVITVPPKPSGYSSSLDTEKGDEENERQRQPMQDCCGESCFECCDICNEMLKIL